MLRSLSAKKVWKSCYAEISLLLGDARKTVPETGGKFDAIFLDPFSHEVNPELWTYDFIREISAKLAEDGVIATYSNAFPVRGAMVRCGLYIGETPAFGRKKGGTIASFDRNRIIHPLSEKEMNIIMKSTAGVPYRDISLQNSRDEICERRRKTVKKLHHLNIPKWYK